MPEIVQNRHWMIKTHEQLLGKIIRLFHIKFANSWFAKKRTCEQRNNRKKNFPSEMLLSVGKDFISAFYSVLLNYLPLMFLFHWGNTFYPVNGPFKFANSYGTLKPTKSYWQNHWEKHSHQRTEESDFTGNIFWNLNVFPKMFWKYCSDLLNKLSVGNGKIFIALFHLLLLSKQLKEFPPTER